MLKEQKTFITFPFPSNQVPDGKPRQWLRSGTHCTVRAGRVLPLGISHLEQLVVQDGVLPLELEVPVELPLLKQEGEPIAVIWPHVGEGDPVQWEPLRPHLWGGWEERG